MPGVLYGNGENIHFHVKETDLNKLVFTPEVAFINLELDGKEYKGIFKEIQFHPVTDWPMHIDFLRLAQDATIAIMVPASPA